ncbi:MAG: N-acetyltransferase [Oscillochloris sp.]|nr:N-acetyltransferase [Oscillochloris sp.]
MSMFHPSADLDPRVEIGSGTRVWHGAQIRAGAQIGRECIIGKNAYIDTGVIVGDRCKIQNNASLYHGLTLEDGVFVGPHVIFTNDRVPRAITPTGQLKSASDWIVGQTIVRYGASIGAGAVIVTGVTVGRWALVGAAAVVTRDVPNFGLVVGNPAQLLCYVSAGGQRCESAEQALELSIEEGYHQ